MRRRHRYQGRSRNLRVPGAMTPAPLPGVPWSSQPSPLAGVPRRLVRDAMRSYQPLPTEPIPWIPGAVGAFVQAPDYPQPVTLRHTAWKAGHRHRRQLVPWLVLPQLPTTVAAARLVHLGAVTAIIAAVVAAVLVKRAWPPREGRSAVAYARRIAAATYGPVLACGWTVWASLAGLISSHALAVYAVGWTAWALMWWNRYRTRHSHGGQQAVDLTPDMLLERLRTRICGQGQRLAGAVVSAAEPMRGGRAFLFSLVPGKQTTDTVLAAAHEIASAAEAPRSRVVVEPAPGELPGEHGPANLARVTVLDAKNPHREIQEFPGLTFDRQTGLFLVGPYPDGEMAPARLCKVDEDGNPMRAASGLTAGAQGSGKSRYIEHKIVEHLLSGLFKVFFIDGQGGASIPALLDHVDWPATRPDEWQRCLRALIRLMIARTRQQAARRVPCWFATPSDPFVQLVMEEAHKPLRDPLNLRMTKTLLQEGEKVGIGVDVVTQFPSQVELGGASGTTGANVLRSLASSGNVTLFRTGDESSKNMVVGAVEVNPRLLPQVPGMCHPLGASMRLAPARAIRAADAPVWAAQQPETLFSGLDVAALGDDYGARWERFAQADAEVDADSLDLVSLARELALITGEEEPGDEPAAERAERSTVIQECWKLISEKGSARRGELIKAIGCSESAVDQALKALAGTGKVRQGSGQGVWEQAGLHAVSGGDDA